MTPVVEVIDASKSYAHRAAFGDVSFHVDAGSLTALTGPSGAGKSTLLNCVGLLDDISAGTIHLFGDNVVGLSRAARTRLYRTDIGFLFQNYALIDSATVAENLAVSWVGQHVPRVDRRDRECAALREVGLPDDRLLSPVYELSGGEQQRVALARLILRMPKLILADEPTGALDTQNSALVLRVLRSFCDRGSAVVVATHDHQVIDEADDVVRLPGDMSFSADPHPRLPPGRVDSGSPSRGAAPGRGGRGRSGADRRGVRASYE